MGFRNILMNWHTHRTQYDPTVARCGILTSENYITTLRKARRNRHRHYNALYLWLPSMAEYSSCNERLDKAPVPFAFEHGGDYVLLCHSYDQIIPENVMPVLELRQGVV